MEKKELKEHLEEIRQDSHNGVDVYKKIVALQNKIEGATINQCDGCRAGHPIVNGIHQVGYPSGNMVCQKNTYNK